MHNGVGTYRGVRKAQQARELPGDSFERNGIYVKKIRTDRPGYVVYEDDWQLVAEPFRKGTVARKVGILGIERFFRVLGTKS